MRGSDTEGYARVEPPCPYVGTCGGCTLQDLAYPDQVRLKHRRLLRALDGLVGPQALQLIPADDPWRYRNKAEFAFGLTEGQLALGYHAAGSFWRVVDLKDCLLMPEAVAGVLEDLRRLVAESQLPPYQVKTHRGVFRHAVIRSSRDTGRLLVCLITTSGHREAVEQIGRQLSARHPAIASLYWGVSEKLSDVAQPEALALLHGDPYLADRVGPFRVDIHPLSFLQPNTAQAQRLYERLVSAVSEGCDGGPSVAWDLYCGMGVIAFYLARCARLVYGIDVEPHSLQMARHNAALNGIANVEFREGPVEQVLLDRRFWLQQARPEVIVVDPPRAGLHPQALASVLAARPRRIAYGSCNVQALARDLRELTTSYPRYRVTSLTAFDMFPHTAHAELLAVLEMAALRLRLPALPSPTPPPAGVPGSVGPPPAAPGTPVADPASGGVPGSVGGRR